MEVIIDGVSYVPIPAVPADKSLLAALEVRFDSDAGDSITVRQYLHRLLATLWEEQEGFSGKRPFGNSGWDFELYAPLIKAGFLEGKLTDDGYIDDVSRGAHSYVGRLIDAAFFGVIE